VVNKVQFLQKIDTLKLFTTGPLLLRQRRKISVFFLHVFLSNHARFLHFIFKFFNYLKHLFWCFYSNFLWSMNKTAKKSSAKDFHKMTDNKLVRTSISVTIFIFYLRLFERTRKLLLRYQLVEQLVFFFVGAPRRRPDVVIHTRHCVLEYVLKH
jgi:hypothetical protein